MNKRESHRNLAARLAALRQAAAPARPALRLGAGAELPLARAHELCGAARMIFAAILAGALEGAGDRGPILWVRAPRSGARLNPDGLAAFFDPSRLVIAAPRRDEDVFWALEEALRSGACRLAVAEAPGRAPGLTQVRRLHLAAEAGAEAAAARGAPPPLGVMLTQGAGGAAGVETRWRAGFAPSAADGADRAPRWRIELARARLAPPRAWIAQWDATQRRLSLSDAGAA
ncbi:ImuA family protein [Oceanicella actignis]|uniref:ImuA family protein n=1 Tax=Oceanicella actignis TaxID=1189325 RepID=UPI0012574621|nr:hypothetical protein [Oceanicella actignis]TYO85398.1 protein ImuA [Oceanicella actignis]